MAERGAKGVLRCAVSGCSGIFEKREVMHVLQYQDRPLVVDQVPALVCSACGYQVLKPEVLRRVETVIRMADGPAEWAPVYRYENWL